MLREQMVLPSLHFLTPAPAPAAGLARAPGLVWCPGGEYVAAIHAAPPPAHITYQHTTDTTHTPAGHPRADQSMDTVWTVSEGQFDICKTRWVLAISVRRRIATRG